jgi:hypothetical protein
MVLKELKSFVLELPTKREAMFLIDTTVTVLNVFSLAEMVYGFLLCY